MNSILLGIVGLIYVWIGINYYLEGNTGLCVAFISYSIANAGIYFGGIR